MMSEKENSIIDYKWYLVPKDYYVFKVNTLSHKIGKKGKKKDEIVGWVSKHCEINFSMSSQLWFYFNIEDIEQYKLCSTEVDNSKTKMTYSQLFKLFGNQTFVA